jgi:hypothetical protein
VQLEEGRACVKWFRFYDEALDDPKVQNLGAAQFKHWVNLLCLASKQDDRGAIPDVRTVAFRLRLKPGEAAVTLSRLAEAGLLDAGEDGSYRVHSWAKRQPRSDDVAPRVARHRAAAVTPLVQTDGEISTPLIDRKARNVTAAETLPETPLDIDVEREKNLSANAERAPGKPARRPLAPAPKPVKERGSLSAAVKAANVILHLTCDQVQREEVDRAVPANQDALERWERCLKEWRLRNHKPQIRGPLDWFADGIPDAKPQRPGPNGMYALPGTKRQPPPPENRMTPEEAAASDAERERVKAQMAERGLIGRFNQIGKPA